MIFITTELQHTIHKTYPLAFWHTDKTHKSNIIQYYTYTFGFGSGVALLYSYKFSLEATSSRSP